DRAPAATGAATSAQAAEPRRAVASRLGTRHAQVRAIQSAEPEAAAEHGDRADEEDHEHRLGRVLRELRRDPQAAERREDPQSEAAEEDPDGEGVLEKLGAARQRAARDISITVHSASSIPTSGTPFT